ncbi:MAG: hypothetical protein IJH39_11005 [Clostridia bacterium]|nr:hypothetical protein [Clostridia bacterium]
MNTKELVNDTVKRSLAKYHEAFTKSLKNQLASLEARVEVVEDSALNITELSNTEIVNIMK